MGMLSVTAAAEPPVRVPFLGDGGPHQPADRFAQLQPVLDFAAGREPATAGVYVAHPVMTQPPAGLKGFEYEPAKMAFYSPPGHDSTNKNEPLAQMQKPLPPERAVDKVASLDAMPVDRGKPAAFPPVDRVAVFPSEGHGRLFPPTASAGASCSSVFRDQRVASRSAAARFPHSSAASRRGVPPARSG